MEETYHTKNHSKYLIRYHIILVTKYREKILKGHLNRLIKQLIFDISNFDDSMFSVVTMETDVDHIHLLVDAEPQVAPTSIVRRIKQNTTIGCWVKYHKLMKSHYWHENTLWSDGYFICTAGEASTETIRKYIDNQG